MKKETTIIALLAFSILTFCLTSYFVSNDFIDYAIVSGAMTLILVSTTLSYTIKTRSNEAIYKNFIKRITKTYDSVMIESTVLPSLKGKNVVKVSKMSDLIDAQIEVKKPIYYNKFQDYAVFILIDNLEALVTIVKKEENTPCQYEVDLNKLLKRNRVKDIDKTILDQIDKTTILKLGESKSFKVSPIRVDNVEQKEFTPKRYHFRKNNIYAILNDDSEVRIMLKDIKNITKTETKEGNGLLKITIETVDGYTYILKDTSDMRLKEVDEKLTSKMMKIKSNFEAKVEYQKN